MTDKAEIDIVSAAIHKANEETVGLSYSDLLREFARVAIEAVDRHRF